MLPRHFRRLVAVAAAIVAIVVPVLASSVQEPSCVVGCISDDSCSFNNPSCMCKAAAKDNLMQDVLLCMWQSCGPSQLASADKSFLNAMQSICTGSRSIPASIVHSAQSEASSLLTKTQSVTAQPTPAAPATTSTTSSSASSSSGSSKTTSSPTSTAKAVSTSTRPASTFTSAASTPAQTTNAVSAPLSSTATGLDRQDPTDSSPFATPVGNGAALPRAAFVGAAALPVAALLAL